MAFLKSALYAFLLSFSFVRSEDLQPLVASTENTLQGAKTHVEHMLNLNPIPNQDKIPSIVKNESEHLAYEIKKLATTLQEKISVGEHKPEVKEAVTAAVTELNTAAASLEHAGADLKEENTKYYTAADSLLLQLKNIQAAAPCESITPTLRAALNELTHDVNNYQHGIHEVIGPHEGQSHGEGHHEHGAGHSHTKVHQHHGASSEESSEDKSKSSSESHQHHH